jgi:hypothetical protein
VQLVSTPIPPDLENAGQQLSEGIGSGEIIGLGVIVQLRGGKFFVDVFGRMVKEPHNARGWVRSLDDCLREIGQARKGSTTTL